MINSLISLMTRVKIPAVWGRKWVILKPEEKLSIELADTLRVMSIEKRLHCIWTHLANEGKRSILVAIIIKAMGMIPGAGDFIFAWSDYSGFVELKVKGGKQSQNQKNFQQWCIMNGVGYALCYSVEEALMFINKWESTNEIKRKERI